MCQFKSTAESDVNRHVEERHVQKCNKCMEEFSSKEDLTNHIAEVHKARNVTESIPTSYVCTKCLHEFHTEEELIEHISKVHDKPEQSHNQVHHQSQEEHSITLTSLSVTNVNWKSQEKTHYKIIS